MDMCHRRDLPTVFLKKPKKGNVYFIAPLLRRSRKVEQAQINAESSNPMFNNMPIIIDEYALTR